MTFVRYSSTLKFLSVASSDLISLVTNSISPSVKPASTSFFFCSSVNLNSVDCSVVSAVASVVVADFSCTADFLFTDEDSLIACASDCAATPVSAFDVSASASSLGCFTSWPVLASVDSFLASIAWACGASTFSAATTFGVKNIM